MYTTDRNVSFGVFPVYQVIASLSHTCYVVKILMKIHDKNTLSLVHANKQEKYKFSILTFNPPKLQTITNKIISSLNFILIFFSYLKNLSLPTGVVEVSPEHLPTNHTLLNVLTTFFPLLWTSPKHSEITKKKVISLSF